MHGFVLIAALLAQGAASAQKPASPLSEQRESQGPQTETAPDAAYYFLLGRHLESDGRLDQAIAAFRKAIELEPESAQLRAELAALFARQDRAVDAMDAAEAALQKDPANREANRIVGSIYAAFAGDTQKVRPNDDPSTYRARAIASLEKVRGDVPDISVEFLLGRLYLETKAFDKAIAALKRVADEQPGYGEGVMLLATALQESGKVDDAVSALEMLIEENPRFYRGYVRLGDLYSELRRPKDAAGAYAAAQLLNPRLDLTTRRAAALLDAGENAEALSLLQAAMKRTTRPDPMLLHLLAHAQLKANDLAGAERALRDLIARDPLDATALNSLGYMFAERGQRLDEAVELLQRAVKIDPANASYLDSLGWAYFQQGKLDLADRPLAEAAAKMPDNPVVLDHLGDLRFKQKRYDDAVKAWQAALGGDGDEIDRAAVEKKLRDAKARSRK
jgi:tetratricopeptide (TPR) repeat protein